MKKAGRISLIGEKPIAVGKETNIPAPGSFFGKEFESHPLTRCLEPEQGTWLTCMYVNVKRHRVNIASRISGKTILLTLDLTMRDKRRL